MRLPVKITSSCHTCWLSYFMLVCLWCGRTVGRCTVTWLTNFLGRVVVYHIFLPIVLRCARFARKSSAVIDDIRIPRRPWDERLYSMIARLKRELFSKNTNKHWLVKAESLQNDRNQQKTARFKSWNLTGKLKDYLFQKTKLREELVALTAKVKKPRSQKKKQEVSKKMVYCVKMSILESFL